MKERRSVHVQSRQENFGIRIESHENERKNDIYIYDCCQYFAQSKSDGTRARVAFVSSDVILLSTVESMNADSVRGANPYETVLTIRPDKSGWSSRTLARQLAEGGADIHPEVGADDIPKDQRTHHNHSTVTDVDDRMEVDDEPVEKFIPSHPIDALHLQVIDHFTLLLKDLAHRVRTDAGDVTPRNRSQHEPGYRQKDVSMWTVGDCLDYLGTKKPLRPSDPPLRCDGTRRGQEWSHQAWKNITVALEDIGNKFEDGAVLGSVESFRQEKDHVFELPLRPTGQ
ncbi:uncharacterized protein B0H18DRAFT_966123 [Fomitopsis serialis]|uniref:uncharacterized protein n=1 Tax=Fomitopsis serialis TaxID=139415 RepID=UPI0020083D21|nr:uncharacterized protein B0H18DRAFT_966123 [Neoantrodia serialis]KAH9938217.1 hypothetical protein B0H18DRAFT_966123 [Neoantrodia serialis]